MEIRTSVPIPRSDLGPLPEAFWPGGVDRVVSWVRAETRPSSLSVETGPPIRILAATGLFGNRQEVAARLGCPTNLTSSELLAHLYARDFLDAPRWITGTLSWILWDEARRSLLAVRDRLGFSPIFYAERAGALYLATGLRPLLELGSHFASPDIVEPATVAAFLGGRPAGARATFFRGLQAVPPGGYLLATAERVEIGQYWQIEIPPLLRLPDDESYGEAFREQLGRVVQEQLAESASTAITLSSGLDSTSVAATLREVSPPLWLTSISGKAPELPDADESAGVRAVSEHLGLVTIPVAMDQLWPLRSEPGIRPGRESPRFNCYTDFWEAIFAHTREQGERILFTGQGGDHLFGGNVFAYTDLLLTGRWRRLAADLRLHRRLWDRRPGWIWRWMILGPLARAYVPLPRRGALPPWLGAALRPLAEAVGSWTRPDWRFLPGQRQRIDLLQDSVWLEETRYLTDRAAQHGVELRNPYLDHRLLEFATSIPAEQTFQGGIRKGIVRRAMAGRLPEEILTRHRKIEATPLFERGLRERETAKVWRLLTGMRAAELGWVDEGLLRAEYQSYLDGTTRRTRFWHALTLEAWLRRWF